MRGCGGGGPAVDDFVGRVKGEGGVGEGEGVEGCVHQVGGIIDEMFVSHFEGECGFMCCVWVTFDDEETGYVRVSCRFTSEEARLEGNKVKSVKYYKGRYKIAMKDKF